jgi:glucokinase
MYLAIDIGGSKTLTALFSEDGNLVASKKIPTDPNYNQFLENLTGLINSNYKDHQITHCCCAVPGTIDFANGIALAFGNEDWHNIPIKRDVQQILPNAKVLIHNDAKLAALSEAVLFGNQYQKILYLTISTGIGGGVILNGKIVIKPNLIIVGGGVGAHFEKFKGFLEEELKKINNPLVPVPLIMQAKRPEEAVIYGCYEFIKQHS